MGRTEGTFMEILDFHAPLAGGNIQFEERRLHFVNTCPINNWLCFLGFICRHFRHEFNELVNLFATFHPEMKAAINDIKEYAYNEAKLNLTNLNNIRCVDNIINLYGTEVEYFINHFKLIMQYTLRSTCSNSNCSTASIEQTVCSYPSVDEACLSENEFKECISQWFFDTHTSP